MNEGAYRVEFAPSARRGLNYLPEKAAIAAVDFCFGPLAEDPHRMGKPLHDELAGQHSARRGGYRIVYRIDEAARLVYVLRVQHRSDVYRPR